MRLLRLLPEQIMTYWDGISRAILEAIPPIVANDQEALNRIQEACLLEQMQVWGLVDDADAEKIYGIATTTINIDPCAGTRNLLVYTVTMLEKHPWSVWEEGYGALSKFAKSRGCRQIIAYTNIIEVVDIAKRLGGDYSWRLLIFDLKD